MDEERPVTLTKAACAKAREYLATDGVRQALRVTIEEGIPRFVEWFRSSRRTQGKSPQAA